MTSRYLQKAATKAARPEGPKGVSKDAFEEGTALVVNNFKKYFVRRRFYETILRDDAFGIPQDERQS